MLHDGLLREINELKSSGFTGEEKPLKSIGYKECFDYLNKTIETEEAMIERINISTRQLAKSQRTWFKKIEKNEYNPLTQLDNLFSDFDNFLKEI